ncbi:MAG: hypothetical protein QXO84_00885 [Candidatus Aenigmatarchaeota archaeon]
MFYAVIEYNGREYCPFVCIYKNEIPEKLLSKVDGGCQVVIGNNNLLL